MRRNSMERFRPSVMAVVLLVGGCGSIAPAQDASSQWIEITTQSDPGGPAPHNPPDDGAAAGWTIDDEEVVIYGLEYDLEPEEALRILSFHTDVSAAVGDLEEVFGERLVLSSFVPGTTEFKIYVTESDPADEPWLAAIDAASLGGTVTIEVDPGRDRPAGPCLDESLEIYGETGLRVIAAGVEIEASLNFEEVWYCPGHRHEGSGGLSADGFLYMLEERVLEVEAGSVVAIVGAGYPGAALDSSLPVVDETFDHDIGHVWQLRVPTDLGQIHVDLRLDWEQGRAHSAFLADVVAP